MLRAATAALQAEVDVRFSSPFEADKKACWWFQMALAWTLHAFMCSPTPRWAGVAG